MNKLQCTDNHSDAPETEMLAGRCFWIEYHPKYFFAMYEIPVLMYTHHTIYLHN